jgi:hypothetical protein
MTAIPDSYRLNVRPQQRIVPSSIGAPFSIGARRSLATDSSSRPCRVPPRVARGSAVRPVFSPHSSSRTAKPDCMRTVSSLLAPSRNRSGPNIARNVLPRCWCRATLWHVVESSKSLLQTNRELTQERPSSSPNGILLRVYLLFG